jgi:hypothetical protein
MSFVSERIAFPLVSIRTVKGGTVSIRILVGHLFDAIQSRTVKFLLAWNFLWVAARLLDLASQVEMPEVP